MNYGEKFISKQKVTTDKICKMAATRKQKTDQQRDKYETADKDNKFSESENMSE